MSEIIDKLEQEHANIEKLLDVLEGELSAFAKAEPVYYELILDIIDYFLDYPDLAHHPKEDLIYQKLRERDPKVAAQVGDLEAEHQNVGTLTREFAQTVRAVLLDTEISREDVVRAAKSFIDFQRRHLEMERTTFFPAALGALNEADWVAIDAAAQDRPDPLFNGVAAQRYERLYRDIMNWSSKA